MEMKMFGNESALKNKNEAKDIAGPVGLAIKEFQKDKKLVVDLLKKEILDKKGATTPREALREVFLLYIGEKYPDEDILKAIDIFDDNRKAIADLFCHEYLEASSLIQKEEAKNKKSIFKGRPFPKEPSHGQKRNNKIRLTVDHQSLASGAYKENNPENL